jgi:integrase
MRFEGQQWGQHIVPKSAVVARPHKLKGFWFLIRRVPKAFKTLDRRNPVRISTGIRITDDPRGVRAGAIVARLDSDLERYWNDKRLGKDPDAGVRYRHACERARTMGFSYAPASQAAASLPIEDVLRRFEALVLRGAQVQPAEVVAVLGGEASAEVMTATMLDEFEDIIRASLALKSERQRKKWRIAKQTALKVFVQVVGNRPLTSLTRTDALRLRSHWQDRVVAGDVEIASANKYLGHVSAMFRAINESRQLNAPKIFERIRISGGTDGQRVAFAADFVQSRILAEGVFDDINPEARRVLYLVAETGLRLSEAISLTRETIQLNGPVPHVCVVANGRELKTDQSRREIPLVGVALLAMREQPDGFPRYRDKPDSLSALVNKAMRTRGLLQEVGQSLYSLRHTFEDRLTAVDAPDKIIACLMGHKWSRPRYGVGPSLEHKRDWLNRIAFASPPAV